MGVGNYMFRNTDMAQTCLSIEAVWQTFDDASQQAFETLMNHLREHPEDAPAGFEPDDWTASDLQVLCAKIIERDVWGDLIDSDVVYGAESYYQSVSDATWEELRSWTIHNLNELGGVQTFEHEVMSEHPYSNRDNYLVLGRGKFCEVGIKSWQHMYYVGAQPTYAIDNYEESIAQMCASEQMRTWQQRLASLALLVQPDNAELKEVAGDALINFPEDVREHFVQRVDAYYTPVAVVDELESQAQEALESDTAEQFRQDYGFDAQEVAEAREALAEIRDVWLEINHLPMAVQAGYEKEHAAMADAIKRACFECTNEVYSSHGGYTSTRVEPPVTAVAQQAAPQEPAQNQDPAPGLG